jgi:hypothetical protein
VRSDFENLSREDLFDILSSDRRRYLLYFLEAESGEAELRRLARLVAAHENGIEPEAVTQKGEKRVYISLYQSHLPKLESADLVEYDADTKRVYSTENVEQIANLFEDWSRPWQTYYLLLAGGGLVLLLLNLIGGNFVPTSILTLGIVGAFLFLSSFHYYEEYYSSPENPLEELV